MLANNFVVKLRIFLWGALAVVVGWLLYMGIVPSGHIGYIYNFTKESYFIKKLTPAERVRPVESGSQKIIGNPVYFALRTPRRFNKARLTLKYKNNSVLPLIEAGVLVDKKIWRYDLRPIENRLLDELAGAWNKIQEGEILLLQREKKYKSISDFLNNLPIRNQIALYNYELKDKFILPDYQPKVAENKIGHALRGPWQVYTYIKNEDLDFYFTFLDLNKNKDADSIDLYLYSIGQLIDSRHMDDDGILSDNGETTPRGELKLKLAGLPEGVYKIELKVNDDIITKEITTREQKLSFINKIWLSQAGEKNLSLFSDSSFISAQTINPGRLQTIKAGEKDLKVTETYKQFSATADNKINEIKLEKDDVILSGDGVFSFNRDSLINPEFKKADSNLDVNKENINYILASYKKPADINGWKVASAEFGIENAYREFYPRQLGGAGKYSFLISVPALKDDDNIDDSIEVGEIRINLEGTSLLDKIKKLFNKND
jgi:hypothetical protein